MKVETELTQLHQIFDVVIDGGQLLVDVVQVLVLHLVVEGTNVGLDFGPAQVNFGAVIFHVLHFGVNAELFARTEDDGLEEVAVGAAFQFGHGLGKLRMSP